MKFAVTVAEFNPFHNGHKYLLDEMKRSADAVVVVMSGNFCQRGEPACLDKYTRAKHAVLAGADLVLELPAAFSTAPAEIFASGAIKLLDALPGEKTLFFGTETGDKQEFMAIAEKLVDESKAFKQTLKELLASGMPYAQAVGDALKSTESGLNFDILYNPNSTLGLEYVKAILNLKSDMDFCPVKRTVGYLDESLKGNICSSIAIRKAIETGEKKKIKKFVPKFVFDDLPESLVNADQIIIYKLLAASADDLKEITDCTEGLQNRIKAFSFGANDLSSLIDKLETKRYTRSRLRRIVLNNALDITASFTERCLKNNLYLKALAVAEDRKDVLSALSESKFRLVTRKADADKLIFTAKRSFEKDVFANRVYSLLTKTPTNEYEMKIVKR